MDWYHKWYLKAKEHKAAAEVLKRENLLRDALARLYYSTFSLMVAVCGEAPKGRWEHKGILKCFYKLCKENEIEIPREMRELLNLFYDKRRVADYTTEVILLEEVEAYEGVIEYLFEVMDD